MKNLSSKLIAISAATLLSCASAVSAAEDITGEWSVTLETEADTMKPHLSLQQDDESVSGTYKDEFGTAQMSGTVQGKEVSLKFKADIPDEDLTVTYTGTVEGDTMKGKVKFGDLGEGTFVAHKQ